MNYWFYDSGSTRFRTIFFSNNGRYSDGGNQYAGEVADDELTVEGRARFRDDLDGEDAQHVQEDLGRTCKRHGQRDHMASIGGAAAGCDDRRGAWMNLTFRGMPSIRGRRNREIPQAWDA